jgi:hypothetical protein
MAEDERPIDQEAIRQKKELLAKVKQRGAFQLTSQDIGVLNIEIRLPQSGLVEPRSTGGRAVSGWDMDPRDPVFKWDGDFRDRGTYFDMDPTDPISRWDSDPRDRVIIH